MSVTAQEYGYEEDAVQQNPACNTEAEQAVIGGLLLAPDRYDIIEGRLEAEDFHTVAYGVIFAAMMRLCTANKPLDILLLRDELRGRGELDSVGGAAALSALTDIVPTGANVEQYAVIVRDCANRRRLIRSCREVQQAALSGEESTEELLGAAEQSLYDISCGNTRDEPRKISTISKSAWARIEALSNRTGSVHGVETGFFELDQMTTGLHGGEMIVVAGRPSMGKSTLALNIARKVAVGNGKGVAIFSLEMTAENMATNLFCAAARLDAQKVRTGQLTSEQFSILTRGIQQIATAPVFIDDSSLLTMGQLRGKARRLKRRHDIELVIVDYLQLISPSARSSRRTREQEVSEISRNIKALAKELDIPVIALSQLSRKNENRADPRPVMSDLRDSGSIEQDADVICLLHRPDYYNRDDAPGQAEVIIAKQRNGPTGTVNLSFIKNQLRFEPLARGEGVQVY